MKNRGVLLFTGLSLAKIILNAYQDFGLHLLSVGRELIFFIIIGLLSIALWSAAGMILVSIGYFFVMLMKPDKSIVPGLWSRASVGVGIGIIFSIMFNKQVMEIIKGF